MVFVFDTNISHQFFDYKINSIRIYILQIENRIRSRQYIIGIYIYKSYIILNLFFNILLFFEKTYKILKKHSQIKDQIPGRNTLIFNI